MKIILAGYGQMGKMLESTLDREGGHDILGVVHPGLFCSGLRFGQLPAASGALPQERVGRGDVESGRGETADLQQDGLLVGGEGAVKRLCRRGLGVQVGLRGFKRRIQF